MTHILRLNEMLAKPKKVEEDFTSSHEALKWLMYEVGPNQWGVANIDINGKTGYLTFGYDINDKGEDLFLHCYGLDGHYVNLTKEYNEVPTGEFCDMVDSCIREYGD